MEGLSTLINSILDGFLSGDLLNITSVVLSIIVIMALAILTVKIVNKVVRSLLKIKKEDKQTVTVGKLLKSVINFFVWFIAISMILTELNINVAPLLASAGVLGFAVGFGAQEVVKDFLGGIFLILDNTMYVGDVVEIDGFKGTIKHIKLRTTSLENWLGQVKTNNTRSIKTIINYSKTNSLAVVKFDVDYSTDLQHLTNIMPDFLNSLQEANENIVETPQFLGVNELGSNSINLMLIAKTKPNEQYAVERMIRKELVKLLNQNNVVIPFPQMVIHNAK